MLGRRKPEPAFTWHPAPGHGQKPVSTAMIPPPADAPPPSPAPAADGATWGEREVIAGLRTGTAHSTLQKGAANLIEQLIRIRSAQNAEDASAVTGRPDSFNVRGAAHVIPPPAERTAICNVHAACLLDQSAPCQFGEPAPARDGQLLTELEHRAMDLTAELWMALCSIVGTQASAEQDLAELATPIHTIQHAILAQAAARAYPDRYRLLGGVLTRTEAADR